MLTNERNITVGVSFGFYMDSNRQLDLSDKHLYQMSHRTKLHERLWNVSSLNALRVFIAICRNPNVICQKKWSNYIYLPFVLNSCKVILVDIKINAKVNT